MITKRLKYVRIATACSAHGIPWSTLKSAIARGEVECAETADGLPLVDPSSVARWKAAAGTRRTGPKKAT